MKSFKALFVFTLGLALAVPAFAETQNVKISGSLDAYGFYRSNFDLNKSNGIGAQPAAATGITDAGGGTNVHNNDADQNFMSITQLEVAADLTDNVSTVVNLINQRDWNANQWGSATTNTPQEFDVYLDLAYVQMKEIFYSPLTLTIGRQDLLFGRGFIVGWNPQDSHNNIAEKEWTQEQSFDAIRATLDFSPWTLDFVYSKVRENSINNNDDNDLYIANVNYKFAEYNAVAEAYYMGQFDRGSVVAGTGITKDNSTDTWGARVQFDPISQITLGAELAYQTGDYYASSSAPRRDRDAWATDLFGEYRFDNPWKPMVGLQYVMLSGESDTTASSSGNYGAWNGAFRSPVYGWIHDYLEVYYNTTQTTDQAAGQNQQHFSVYGSINPMQDLKLTGNYWHFSTDAAVHPTPSTSLSSDIGDELDTALIYSYTEDVTFSFYANWFFPGKMFSAPNDATASEYVSEVKVTF